VRCVLVVERTPFSRRGSGVRASGGVPSTLTAAGYSNGICLAIRGLKLVE